MSSVSGSISVLCVDDEPDLANLTASFLERFDSQFSASTARSARKALDFLAESHVDCVVSDYDMPGMDGIELLREVRSNQSGIPFILLTGQGSEDIVSEAVTAGVTDYFKKAEIPQQFPVLAHRIETAVEGVRAEVSYRNLFEKAIDGFALNDPETGAFIDVNSAFQELLGVQQEQLLSMEISDLCGGATRQEPGPSLAACLRQANDSERTIQTEKRYQRLDGKPIWLEFQFKPIQVMGRSLVLAQAREITAQKRFEETLSALHTAIVEIVAAKRTRDVTRSVLTATDDLLGSDRSAVYRHASARNRLEVVDATVLENAVSEVSLTPDHPLSRAFIEGEMVETASDTVFDDATEDGSTEGKTLLVPTGSLGVLAIGYDDAASFECDDPEFAEILANAAGAAFERFEKAAEIHSSHQEISRQTAEMQRLERVNETLRDLNDSLLHAETRSEVFETVCEQLVRIDDIKLAWIGTPAEAGGLEKRSWAGGLPEYLDIVPLESGASNEPAVVAAREGTAVRVQNTAVNPQGESWRRTALANGVESALALPIEVDGVTYGVLSVLAAESAVFDDEFENLLTTVASSIGETIHAVDTRQGIQTAGTTELSFEIESSDHLFGRLATTVGCTLDVTGVIPETEDTCRVFIDVQGAPPNRVTAAGESLNAVREVIVGTESEMSGTVEMHLEVPLLGTHLTDLLVRITQFTASVDGIHATVAVAQPSQVRKVAAGILEQYQGAQLLAKRTRADSDGIRNRLLAFPESLTPRQREVVHTAYLNGYFESPRQCTGEELGEKLEISSQAVYQHIREVERRLFNEVFHEILSISMSDG